MFKNGRLEGHKVQVVLSEHPTQSVILHFTHFLYKIKDNKYLNFNLYKQK